MTDGLGDAAVFVDTSAWAALIDRRDRNHGDVVAIHQRLVAERRQLLTTNIVLAELHALLLSRTNAAFARRMLFEIVDGDTAIERVIEADELRMRAILTVYDDKDFSYTDATSFAVMERWRISTAFTLDRHFLQFGFQVLGIHG